jgi:hypothetical protein
MKTETSAAARHGHFRLRERGSRTGVDWGPWNRVVASRWFVSSKGRAEKTLLDASRLHRQPQEQFVPAPNLETVDRVVIDACGLGEVRNLGPQRRVHKCAPHIPLRAPQALRVGER